MVKSHNKMRRDSRWNIQRIGRRQRRRWWQRWCCQVVLLCRLWRMGTGAVTTAAVMPGFIAFTMARHIRARVNANGIVWNTKQSTGMGSGMRSDTIKAAARADAWWEQTYYHEKRDRAGRKTPALSFMAICLKNHPVPAHPALRQIRSMVSAVMVGDFLVVGRGDRDCCVIYIVFFHIYLWLVFLFCRFFRGFFLLVFPD